MHISLNFFHCCNALFRFHLVRSHLIAWHARLLYIPYHSRCIAVNTIAAPSCSYFIRMSISKRIFFSFQYIFNAILRDFYFFSFCFWSFYVRYSASFVGDFGFMFFWLLLIFGPFDILAGFIETRARRVGPMFFFCWANNSNLWSILAISRAILRHYLALRRSLDAKMILALCAPLSPLKTPTTISVYRNAQKIVKSIRIK